MAATNQRRHQSDMLHYMLCHVAHMFLQNCARLMGITSTAAQRTLQACKISSDLNSIHLVYFSIFSRISIHFWQLKLSKRYTFYFGLYARYRAVYRTALAATQAQVCMRCRHTSFAVLNPLHRSHSEPYLWVWMSLDMAFSPPLTGRSGGQAASPGVNNAFTKHQCKERVE